MSQIENEPLTESKAKARRDFLKKAGTVGMTAPAVALLMSAKPKQALAVTSLSPTQTRTETLP
jgi:hypothetical protein